MSAKSWATRIGTISQTGIASWCTTVSSCRRRRQALVSTARERRRTGASPTGQPERQRPARHGHQGVPALGWGGVRTACCTVQAGGRSQGGGPQKTKPRDARRSHSGLHVRTRGGLHVRTTQGRKWYQRGVHIGAFGWYQRGVRN